MAAAAAVLLRRIMQRNNIKYIGCLLAAAGVLALSACSSKKQSVNDNQTLPVAKLYNDALAKLHDHDYKEAIKGFEDVERQHSYSEWAVRAEIMAAYASFRDQKYEVALGDLERFVKQHPENPNTSYAYYLRAMCYYVQITDVGRDQRVTTQAQQALNEVVDRFPDSEYARDAKLKLDLVSDHLAGKEMEVGRYYERHQDYLAAINRFRVVVEKYQTTSHIPEALHRLVECYLKLGVADQARKYAAVLGYNYPSSSWYKDSYADMKGRSLPPDPGSSTLVDRILPWHRF